SRQIIRFKTSVWQRTCGCRLSEMTDIGKARIIHAPLQSTTIRATTKKDPQHDRQPADYHLHKNLMRT
ncbi:MAG: hypothetical protein WAU34_03330, partial [Desulfobacterales bacterium]